MSGCRRALAARLLSVLGLVLGLVLPGACGRRPRQPADRWIAEVTTTNRRADRLLDAHDAAGARALLRKLIATDRPSAPLTDARRIAFEDTYFRLARLALAAGDPHQALADAEAGLAHQTGPSLFVANLLVARGAAHEALDDPRAATEDYHRALVMNEALLHEAVGAP